MNVRGEILRLREQVERLDRDVVPQAPAAQPRPFDEERFARLYRELVIDPRRSSGQAHRD